MQTRSLADMSSMAYATLRACVDEERAPVFAIFKLQRYECQKLFLESEDGFSVVGNVGRDMVIKIAAAFDDKEIDGRLVFGVSAKVGYLICDALSQLVKALISVKGVNAEGGEERYADDLTQIKLQCGEYMQGLLRDIPQELLQKTSFDGYESFDKLRKSVADIHNTD